MSARAAAGSFDQALTQAIEWAIKVEFNQPDASTRRDFERWLAADAINATAWDRVARIQASFRKLPADAAIGALNSADSACADLKARRRAMLKLMLLVGVGAPASWLAYERAPWQRLAADETTSFGQIRTIELADGTIIKLNTDSAISVDLSDRSRTITARRGEIAVVTGADAALVARGQPKRPFWVNTPFGRVQALGTRFAVRLEAGRARVSLQQGAIEMTPRAGGEVIRITPGQTWWLYQDRGELAQPTGIGAVDWTDGLVIADKARLDTLVAELARYRRGIITCDDAVAEMRVSGFYHIADTDRALRFLSNSESLDVAYLTRYWVQVGPRRSK